MNTPRTMAITARRPSTVRHLPTVQGRKAVGIRARYALSARFSGGTACLSGTAPPLIPGRTCIPSPQPPAEAAHQPAGQRTLAPPMSRPSPLLLTAHCSPGTRGHRGSQLPRTVERACARRTGAPGAHKNAHLKIFFSLSHKHLRALTPAYFPFWARKLDRWPIGRGDHCFFCLLLSAYCLLPPTPRAPRPRAATPRLNAFTPQRLPTHDHPNFRPAPNHARTTASALHKATCSDTDPRAHPQRPPKNPEKTDPPLAAKNTPPKITTPDSTSTYAKNLPRFSRSFPAFLCFSQNLSTLLNISRSFSTPVPHAPCSPSSLLLTALCSLLTFSVPPQPSSR